ncbi:MAG: hypothetical protein AB4050_17225 [Synechococcus sp.]
MKALLLSGLLALFTFCALPTNAQTWTYTDVQEVIAQAVESVGEEHAPELLRNNFNQCMSQSNQEWSESCEVYAAAAWYMIGLQSGFDVGYSQGYADADEQGSRENYGVY